MYTPLSKARSKPSRRMLILRNVSASATPIEVFGNDWERSKASGSTPSSPANRRQMSSLAAVGSRMSTWIRSGGTACDHRWSTSLRSSVRQFQITWGFFETRRP